MKSKALPIKDIEPMFQSRDDNPNKMSDERYAGLKALMEAEGCLQPILVYQATGSKKWKLVDGHHRFWIAFALGWTDIECIIAPLEEKAHAIALAMNRLRGELDLSLSAEIMKDLFVETGWDANALSLNTGFTVEEVTSLLESAKTTDDANLGDLGAASPPEDDAPPDKPFVLEIPFKSKEDMRLVRRKLRKAAGKGGDLATGLLNVLGESHGE